MKIYQINVVCGSGSTGRIAFDLAHTIEKKDMHAELPMAEDRYR